MPFSVGDRVIVVSIGRNGEIEAVVRAGKYRVRMGALVTTAAEGDLRPAPAGKKRPRRTPSPAPGLPDATTPPVEPPPDRLDLHGLTVDDARNRVAAYISRALVAGLERVEIVHGIGTGRLKAAVTADLKRIAAVRHLAPHPTNPGVVVVYF